LHRFDPHQGSRPTIRHTRLINQEEITMSDGSILVSAAAVSVFVLFAAVLIWGNFQTEPARQRSASVARRRRSF
jgi:hypothetical protein